MKFHIARTFVFSVLTVMMLCVCGCGESTRQTGKGDIEKPTDLNTSIGDLGELYDTGEMPVIGFGIVAGLPGTGSSECPPDLRAVLIKYIQQQVPAEAKLNPGMFINSKDTAVVQVYGTLPRQASSGQSFDVTVEALASTQTTSLDGGYLYLTELKPLSRVAQLSFSQYTKVVAVASGAIFINKLDETKAFHNTGTLLGGAKVLEDTAIRLRLFEPNYFTASTMRNRLNERFGTKTAIAKNPEELEIKIPKRYRDKKMDFLAMVNLLYLSTDARSTRDRINTLVDELLTSEDKLASERALAAIGKASLNKLAPLLDSDVELVRFHAGRCMLSIDDSRGLDAVKKIARDTKSPNRIAAIQTIGSYAERNSALIILRSVVSDADFDVAFAAYEQLRRLGDISISQELVADLLVEQIIYPGPKRIFVSRAKIPKIVLFGAPIYCEKDLFVEYDGGNIVINAPLGAKYISIMRRHPRRPKLIGPFQSRYNVLDVVKTLSESAIVEDKLNILPGLGVSYSDLIALLRQMVLQGDIKAEFIPGQMSEAGTNLKKKPSDSR